jgi:hypothetical protein
MSGEDAGPLGAADDIPPEEPIVAVQLKAVSSENAAAAEEEKEKANASFKGLEVLI